MTRVVYIVGPNKRAYAQMFQGKGGYTGTTDINKADIVLFTGGPDVDPTLYNEKALCTTITDVSRDVEDMEAYEASKGKVRVGICRGAQFLNVMNGGKLWQDVDNHETSHFIKEIGSDRRIWSSSTHHQQMRPNFETVTLIAHSTTHTYAQTKFTDHLTWRRNGMSPSMWHQLDTLDTMEDPEGIDWEVLWYRGTSSLCFQPHPEFASMGDCRQYFFQKLGIVIAYHENKDKAA